jgi:hypothetical protein
MNQYTQIDTFLRLRDTPDSYGAAGQGIRVNSAGNGLEFATAVAIANLPPTPSLGDVACVNNGAAGLAWGDTVTGTASAKYLVWWNGANWKVIGK